MTKEHHIRDYLLEDFDNVKLFFNKVNNNNTIDVRIDRLTHNIIVECVSEKLSDETIKNYRNTKSEILIISQ